MHALDLSLAPLGIVAEPNVALAAHVLSGHFNVIFAPVGLRKFQHGELCICVEIVTVVEDGDLSGLLVHCAHRAVGVVFNEVILESRRGLFVHVEVLAMTEGKGATNTSNFTYFHTIRIAQVEIQGHYFSLMSKWLRKQDICKPDAHVPDV